MTMIEAHDARGADRRPAPPDAPAGPTMSLSEGVITADHDFVVRTVNAPAAQALGWEDAESLAHHLNRTDWDILAADTRRELRASLAGRRRWEGPVAVVRPDGATVGVMVTACALNGAGGMPAGVVVVIRPLPTEESTEPATEPATGPATEAPDADTFRVAGLPGHFLLHYQPEVDLETRDIMSCEALLRWRHPALGIVSPGATLSQPTWAARLASLEAWAQMAACRQAAAWAELDRPLRISINLSSQQLADPGLVHRLRTDADRTGLPASCLAVEIHYSDLLLRPSLVRRVVNGFDDQRIAVVLDHVDDTLPDRLIEGLPVTTLKLAPSTTRDVASSASRQRAVRDLVAVAADLGACTTAACVEQTVDADALQGLGVDRAFGLHYIPPMAADALALRCWGTTGPRRRLRLVR